MASQEISFTSIATNAQLAEYCGVSWDELKMLAYANRIKRYTEWLVPKRNGEGFRRISSPMANLRRVQRAIANGLSEFYSPLKCVYGFVCERNVAMNALQHARKRTVLTLDLKDFFPSISAPRVRGLFMKAMDFPQDVADTLTNLVCYEGSLPQGAPTSPVISNMICFKMDRALLNFAANSGFTYTRYADDLVFSSTSAYSARKMVDQGKNVVDGINRFIIDTIESNGFEINERKVHVANRGSRQIVNGIIVNQKCNIRRSQYREFRALFHRWIREGCSSAAAAYFGNKKNHCYKAKLCDGDELCDEKSFVRHIRGRLDYFSMVVGVNGHPTEPMAKLWTLFHQAAHERVPYLTFEKSAVQLSYVFDSKEKNDAVAAESSGVIVRDILLTCAHGLPEESTDANGDAVPIEIRTAFDERFYIKASSFRKCSGFDFAFVLLDAKLGNMGVRSINTAYLPQAGETIYASGYAGGKMPSHCVQASVLPNRYGNGSIVVDRAFIKGMSGGPVFNTRHEVIGIVLKGSDESSYSRDGEFLPFSAIADLEPFALLKK
ncbi:reverse transcriptase domain-containing protein [Olsenella sp. An290]|uniref:reverse transcriptase domain-containing protein n=1 Tax=Olsenella sp. An290 TaxID=1965625 RepID=UPI000B39A8DB|nr:reverse transcriptase domain-containing protein [Olsenella sp. An290]OUO35056.1 hypothetical protein B5F84_03900 [Olsenella sp. An290]